MEIYANPKRTCELERVSLTAHICVGLCPALLDSEMAVWGDNHVIDYPGPASDWLDPSYATSSAKLLTKYIDVLNSCRYGTLKGLESLR